MHLSTLPEWLNWIGSVHNKEIDLGLERVKAVAKQLGLLSPKCPVIIVGGTNGKGSTVAGLESIYQAAGYQVGTFTSPILFKHNEYVRMNGENPSDEAFCEAYERISYSMSGVSLTPFEFHALAALWMFKRNKQDVLILEVGMGGRLDAVNILDADVAVVTSIDIDHTDWLGKSREEIALEKAGIFRSGKDAVLGDLNPPSSILNFAEKIHTHLVCHGKDFFYSTEANGKHWNWSYNNNEYKNLPINTLALQNMAVCLMAIHLLQKKLPVGENEIKKGLANVHLPGRIQLFPGLVTEIHDVSHNPAAVAHLANYLKQMSCKGKRLGVFSMLGDKDISLSICQIKEFIDHWYVAPLDDKRAASKEQLSSAFTSAGVNKINWRETIMDAYQEVKENAKKRDCIIVFGSFKIISQIRHLKKGSK